MSSSRTSTLVGQLDDRKRVCRPDCPERAPRGAPSATPTTAPPRPISTCSVSSCRAIRPRPAPSATRTAISVRRDAARPTSRFATFVQAMSSTTSDDEARSPATRAAASAGDSGSTAPREAASGQTRDRGLRPGESRWSCADSASASAWTAGAVVRSARRPIIENWSSRRSVIASAMPGMNRRSRTSGSQSPRAGRCRCPVNSRGSTPTTSQATPLRRTVRPTMPGSDANCLSHRSVGEHYDGCLSLDPVVVRADQSVRAQADAKQRGSSCR